MATYKVQPPDIEECKSFDVYLTKLKVWEATTPAPEDKRGAIIASCLPNNSKRYKKDLQDKFFVAGMVVGDMQAEVMVMVDMMASLTSDSSLARTVKMIKEWSRDADSVILNFTTGVHAWSTPSFSKMEEQRRMRIMTLIV